MDDSITADFYFNKYSAHGNEIFILNCATSYWIVGPQSNFVIEVER